MPKNADLNAAKRDPKDEFYTTRQDIEAELTNYADFFKDKVVYCNCDDPVTSEFWQFFVRNFRAYGLKKLMATHYEPDEKNYAYMLEICEDTNGDGRIDWRDEPTITQIPCNGDFRSAYCIELLKQADVAVTNPPFSLFREYMAQLMEYQKKFIIIGNLNALKYKEIFPYIKNNEVWMGVSIHSGDRKFYVPDDYPLKAAACGIDEEGRRFIRVKGVRWYTNVDMPQRHSPIDLRGNYYYGNEEQYPKYDNFDAIDVSNVADIPSDYYEYMGVPISFMDRYCPEQFEVIGMGTGDTAKEIGVTKNYRGRTDLSVTVNGKTSCPYTRIIIKRKEQPAS